MQCKLFDKNFRSLDLIQPDLKTCLTSFTRSISRMSEFGLLIMYITVSYLHVRLTKLREKIRKKCLFQKHKDLIKVVRYF